MPYWLESDTFHEDPIWEVLADGDITQLDRLQAAYCRLKSQASHNLSDGYLTEQAALALCRRRRTLELLCTAVLGRSPLMHRRGDDCECLGPGPWVDGYAFRIHQFLKRNPSRSEYQRSRAQRAELRDPRLKAAVYGRDGGCCRYCQSGPLSPKAVRSRDRRKVLTYDHIDPDQPAGEDGANLVVACGRCNEHKGRRTPDEADMVLLPPPSIEEAKAWRDRSLALFDQPTDHRRITDESATDHRSDHERDHAPIADPPGAPDGAIGDDPARPVHAQPIDDAPDQRPDRPPEGAGLGRGGHPGIGGDPHRPDRLAQPTRTPSDPDIYHRRSRAPSTTPPAPEYAWPPGAVPATEPRSHPS